MGNRWTLACLIMLFFIFIIILFVVKQLTLVKALYDAIYECLLLAPYKQVYVYIC